MSFELKPLKPNHLPALIELENLVYEFPWARSHFEDCFKPHYEAWLLWQAASRQLIGYVILSFVVDEASLLNICVHPEYRGQGHARTLLDLAQQIAERRSCSTLWLEVRRSNQRAQQLYLQNGFVEQGVRKNYYPSTLGREDALIMALPLSFDFAAGAG